MQFLPGHLVSLELISSLMGIIRTFKQRRDASCLDRSRLMDGERGERVAKPFREAEVRECGSHFGGCGVWRELFWKKSTENLRTDQVG